MNENTRNDVEKAFSRISDRILKGLFFKKDGSLNWFGYVSAIIAALFVSAILSLLGGCANLYTRCPATDARIERTYQCSGQAATLSVVASFPQMMSDTSESGRLRWENCLTIPFLGLPIAVDAACEFCIDTVLFPCDYLISDSRKGGGND